MSARNGANAAGRSNSSSSVRTRRSPSPSTPSASSAGPSRPAPRAGSAGTSRPGEIGGGRDVVRIPSWRSPRGRVTGLMGPSGCGKTTLMRAIVGVQRVARGRVDVLGRPVGSAALRRRVGYMTQAPSVYADLTVRENLRFFAPVLGVRDGRADEVVDGVKARDRPGQLVRDLSGGERARVSLAAVLLGEPELLVLDEPTVGLEP